MCSKPCVMRHPHTTRAERIENMQPDADAPRERKPYLWRPDGNASHAMVADCLQTRAFFPAKSSLVNVWLYFLPVKLLAHSRRATDAPSCRQKALPFNPAAGQKRLFANLYAPVNRAMTVHKSKHKPKHTSQSINQSTSQNTSQSIQNTKKATDLSTDQPLFRQVLFFKGPRMLLPPLSTSWTRSLHPR